MTSHVVPSVRVRVCVCIDVYVDMGCVGVKPLMLLAD
jgi:hypothetical protein